MAELVVQAPELVRKNFWRHRWSPTSLIRNRYEKRFVLLQALNRYLSVSPHAKLDARALFPAFLFPSTSELCQAELQPDSPPRFSSMLPARASNPLRVVTQRLNTTHPDQLPYITSHLTSALLDCASLLGAPPDKIERGSENAASLQQFKTLVSNLLQGKSVGGRWTAVLLVKTSVEVGRLQLIQGGLAWVRSMIGILGAGIKSPSRPSRLTEEQKPDPTPTKKAIIVTLTRIFTLTHDEPSIAREITTPSLPSFVNNCLSCILSGPQNSRTVLVESPVLVPVLQAFIKLLPSHPTIFRPSLAHIKVLLSQLVAPTVVTPPNNSTTTIATIFPSQAAVGLAQRLHALLSQSAPKNGAPEHWANSVNTITAHASRTADHVFRALVEDRADHRLTRTKTQLRPFNETIGDEIDDDLGLSRWSGITAGSQRLVGVMQLLEAYIATSSLQTLTLPVSTIWSLAERMLSVFGPPRWNSPNPGYQTSINLEADREEREDLWLALPDIHLAAIDILSTMVRRLGITSLSLCQMFLERVVWTFERDVRYSSVRTSLYGLATLAIGLMGPSLTKSMVGSLQLMINSACEDCQRPTETPCRFGQEIIAELDKSAASFVTEILSTINPHHWTLPLRAAMDRAAIFTQNKDAMVASVLNPTISKARQVTSILPFLVRIHGKSAEAESIMKPRLPVIRTNLYRDGMVEETEPESLKVPELRPRDAASPLQDAVGASAPQARFRTETVVTEVLTGQETGLLGPALQSPKRLRESNDTDQTAAPVHVPSPEPKRQRITDDTSAADVLPRELFREPVSNDNGVEAFSRLRPTQNLTNSNEEVGEHEEIADRGVENDYSDSDSPSIHMDLDDLVDDDEDENS